MTTKTELLEELRRLASEQGPDITLFQFREQTGISRYQVYDRWGNWTSLRRAAGLPPRVAARPVYSDDELLGEFHRTASRLGHLPTCNEFSRLSERSWDTLDRRFGRKADVVDKYRGWLDQQPADARPEFLAGLAADSQPGPTAKAPAPQFFEYTEEQEAEFMRLVCEPAWSHSITDEVARAFRNTLGPLKLVLLVLGLSLFQPAVANEVPHGGRESSAGGPVAGIESRRAPEATRPPEATPAECEPAMPQEGNQLDVASRSLSPVDQPRESAAPRVTEFRWPFAHRDRREQQRVADGAPSGDAVRSFPFYRVCRTDRLCRPCVFGMIFLRQQILFVMMIDTTLTAHTYTVIAAGGLTAKDGCFGRHLGDQAMGRVWSFACALGLVVIVASSSGRLETRAEDAVSAAASTSSPAADNSAVPAPAPYEERAASAAGDVAKKEADADRCQELERQIRTQADRIADLEGRLKALEVLLNGGSAPATPGLVATVDRHSAAIAAQSRDIAKHTRDIDVINQRFTGLKTTVDDHGEWLKELSVNRVSPGSGKNVGPDIFGRMQEPAGNKPVDLKPLPEEAYIHQVQRATNGKLKLFNHSGKDQRRIINGAPWLISPGESYVWVPLGPLTVGVRGGEVPQEFGTPTSPDHRQWLFDRENQWFYIAYEIE